jgi:exodeoxyribonuclease VII small subunit
MPEPAGSDQSPLTFEQSLAELQRIVDDLESGTIGLEESLRRFEQGTALLRSCYRLLETAEQRIEVLSRRGANGELTTKPFDAEATHQAESPTAGRRSRKGRATAEPEPPDDFGDTLF